MSRLASSRLAIVGLALVVAFAAASMRIQAGETTKKVRLIYSNDTLGYLEPCG